MVGDADVAEHEGRLGIEEVSRSDVLDKCALTTLFLVRSANVEELLCIFWACSPRDELRRMWIHSKNTPVVLHGSGWDGVV